MALILIDSLFGQIGPLWWVNSRPQATRLTTVSDYNTRDMLMTLWGGWGWGSRTFVRPRMIFSDLPRECADHGPATGA